MRTIYKRSIEAEQYRKLYNTKDWYLLRKQHLVIHPLCARCLQKEKLTPATVVHHVKPHKGNLTLFYNTDNLESLCASHHNSEAQQEEVLGYSPKIGNDGWPVDTKHPFNNDSNKTKK